MVMYHKMAFLFGCMNGLGFRTLQQEEFCNTLYVMVYWGKVTGLYVLVNSQQSVEIP